MAGLVRRLVLAQLGCVPTLRVEHLGFPHGVVEASKNAKGIRGVLECPLMVADLLCGPCDREMCVSLPGQIRGAFGQRQSHVMLAKRVVHAVCSSMCVAEHPVGQDLDAGFAVSVGGCQAGRPCYEFFVGSSTPRMEYVQRPSQ